MPYVLCLLSGALLSLAYPRTNWWPVALVALAYPIFRTLRASRPREAFWAGYIAGIGFFSLHLRWVIEFFSDFLGSAGWILTVLLVAGVSLFWGLPMWLSALMGRTPGARLWLLALWWVAAEKSRSLLFWAFPWGLLGNTLGETPLIQIADITGIYGPTLLILLMNGGWGWLLTMRRQVMRPLQRLFPLLLELALGAVALFYGSWRLAEPLPPAPHQALIVQGNIDPREKGSSQSGTFLDSYLGLTREALGTNPELVIWPEGAILTYLDQDQRAQDQIRTLGVPVITGAPSSQGYNRERQLLGGNAVHAIWPGGYSGPYNKVHLVPFSEGLPFRPLLDGIYRFFFSLAGFQTWSWQPGQAVIPLETPAGSFGAYVCYESVFPDIARAMVRSGAQALINVSNDGWFGGSSGPWQHLAMGNVRAIETRRYLLRSGNTGITAVIDPYGRVQDTLDMNQVGTLLAGFDLRDELTFYVRWGDWLPALALILLLATLLWRLAGGQGKV
ncbi:MAG: apolipoprotein N-acyltransferase [Deinococcus sp.]|nr:apolipoprotein N-acyltransferase [Deinococcus sp.]